MSRFGQLGCALDCNIRWALAEPPEDAPRLYWSLHGEVACEAHAPSRDDPRWEAERWEPVPVSERYRCEHCHPDSLLEAAGVHFVLCSVCRRPSERTGETRIVPAPGASPGVWQWQVEYICPEQHRQWVFVDVRIEDPDQ